MQIVRWTYHHAQLQVLQPKHKAHKVNKPVLLNLNVSITFTSEKQLPYDNIPQLKILIFRHRMNSIKQKKGKRPHLKIVSYSSRFQYIKLTSGRTEGFILI